VKAEWMDYRKWHMVPPAEDPDMVNKRKRLRNWARTQQNLRQMVLLVPVQGGTTLVNPVTGVKYESTWIKQCKSRNLAGNQLTWEVRLQLQILCFPALPFPFCHLLLLRSPSTPYHALRFLWPVSVLSPWFVFLFPAELLLCSVPVPSAMLFIAPALIRRAP
jgi:hypothetical protein